LAGPTDDRTPDERAAAAAERAARRAERGGDGPSVLPPPETFAATARPAAPVAPEPEYPPLEEEPFAAPEPEPDPEPELEPDPEPLPPPRRIPSGGPRRVSSMATRAPRRPRRPPPPRRPPTARRPPRRPGAGHGRRRLVALGALALLILALYVLNATFQPFHGEGEGAVQVKVPEGANAGRIGDLLEERGVVDSGTFFQLNATVTGRRGNLRPGDYTLLRGMTHGAALDALVKGPKAKVVKTVNVTVPEGLSIREAAPVVDKGPLRGSYLKAARSSRTLQRIRKLGAPSRRTRRSTRGAAAALA